MRVIGICSSETLKSGFGCSFFIPPPVAATGKELMPIVRMSQAAPEGGTANAVDCYFGLGDLILSMCTISTILFVISSAAERSFFYFYETACRSNSRRDDVPFFRHSEEHLSFPVILRNEVTKNPCLCSRIVNIVPV